MGTSEYSDLNAFSCSSIAVHRAKKNQWLEMMKSSLKSMENKQEQAGNDTREADTQTPRKLTINENVDYSDDLGRPVILPFENVANKRTLPRIAQMRMRSVRRIILLLSAAISVLYCVSELLVIDWTDIEVRLNRLLFMNSITCASVPFLVPVLRHFTIRSSMVHGIVIMGIASIFNTVQRYVTLMIANFILATVSAVTKVSVMVYFVKLARIYSTLTGIAERMIFVRFFGIYQMWNQINLALQSFVQFVMLQENGLEESRVAKSKLNEECGASSCSRDMSWLVPPPLRLRKQLPFWLFLFVVTFATMVALCAIILVAVKIPPLGKLSKSELSEEPRPASWRDIFWQIRQPKAIYFTALFFMSTLTSLGSFESEYASCWLTRDHFLVSKIMSHVSGVFACIGAFVVIDIFELHLVFSSAIVVGLAIYGLVQFWPFYDILNKFSFYVLMTVLRYSSCLIELSVCIAFVETFIVEEVSGWCFFVFLDHLSLLIAKPMLIYTCAPFKSAMTITGYIVMALTYFRLYSLRPIAEPEPTKEIGDLHRDGEEFEVVSTRSDTDVSQLLKGGFRFYAETERYRKFAVEKTVFVEHSTIEDMAQYRARNLSEAIPGGSRIP